MVAVDIAAAASAAAAISSSSKDLVALRKASYDINGIISDPKHYDTFVCSICKQLTSLDCVVTSRCNHLFCRQCLEESIMTQTPISIQNDINNTSDHSSIGNIQSSTIHSCPKCRTSIRQDLTLGWHGNMSLACTVITARPLQESQPIAYEVLKRIQVRCCHKTDSMSSPCSWTGDYGKYLRHIASHSIVDGKVSRQCSPERQVQCNPVSIQHEMKPQQPILNSTSLTGSAAAIPEHSNRNIPSYQDDHSSGLPLHQQIQSYLISPPKRSMKKANENKTKPLIPIPSEIVFQIGGNSSSRARGEGGGEGRVDDDNEDYCGKDNKHRSNDTVSTIQQMDDEYRAAITKTTTEVVSSMFSKFIDAVALNANAGDKQQQELPGINETMRKQIELNAEKAVVHQKLEYSDENRETHFSRDIQESDNDADMANNNTQRLQISTKENEEPTADVIRISPESNSMSDEIYKESTAVASNQTDDSAKENTNPIVNNLEDESNQGDNPNDTMEPVTIEYDLDDPQETTKTTTNKKKSRQLDNSICSTTRHSQFETGNSISHYEQSESCVEDEQDGEGLTDEQRYEKMMTRADKLKKQANAKFNKGKFDEARKLYTESIDMMSMIVPSTEQELSLLSIMHSNRAVTYFREREYHPCIDDCNIAIKYDPTHDKSWIRKWRALMGLGKFYDAYNCLEEATVAIPTAKKIVSELEKMNIEKEILEEAETLLNNHKLHEARDLLASKVVVTENIAMICLAARIDMHLGCSEDALDKLKKAIRLNPTQPEVRELKAVVYFVDGDVAYGIEVLQEAMNTRNIVDFGTMKETLICFQTVQNALSRGRDAVEIRMFDTAIQQYTEAIETYIKLPPQSQLFAILRKERSEAYVLSQQFSLALHDCEEVLKYQADFPEIVLLKAEIFLFMGKPFDAKRDLAFAKTTWGANDSEVEDAYFRADFETRVVRADDDIQMLMEQLDDGIFDLDVGVRIQSNESYRAQSFKRVESFRDTGRSRSPINVHSISSRTDNVLIKGRTASNQIEMKKRKEVTSKKTSSQEMGRAQSERYVTGIKPIDRRETPGGVGEQQQRRKANKDDPAGRKNTSRSRSQRKEEEGITGVVGDRPRYSSRNKTRESTTNGTSKVNSISLSMTVH